MLQRFFTRVGTLLKSRGTGAFLLASIILGFLVGVAAAVLVLLIGLVEGVTEWFDGWWDLGRWLWLVVIPIGLFASWWINRKFGPGISGGGVTETMVGLTLNNGYLPTRAVPAKTVATAATLGTGGSGGREGPIVLIGAALGSSFGRYGRFGQDQIRSLLAAGAGAGIGASFNAPIAGMLFALEVILGSFAIRHLNAVVIASVVAAVTTQQIIGEERLLTSRSHELGDPKQLVLFAVLALVAVVFGLLFLKVIDVVGRIRARARFTPWLIPLVAGVIVAAIGLAAPESLGTGQDFLNELLRLPDGGDYVWYALFAIAGAKILTTVVTRSGGGSAGTFMPALVIGGALGSGFAILVQPVWGFSELDAGAFAVVGMAASVSATARAPLTAVILVFEVTGDYGLVLPLMLAAALGTFLGDKLHPDSAYIAPLTKRGIHLPRNEDIDLLDTVTVREVMSAADTVATPSMSLAFAVDRLNATRHHGIPVVDDRRRLAGIITLTDIADAGGPSEDVTVGEAMTKSPIVVTADQPVSSALARMAAFGIGRMPVVAEDDPTRIVGMFRRESVVRAYHHALGTATGRELYRERVRLRTDPGAAFFDVPIRRGSPLAGVRVRDVAWPVDATVVSVRRGASVLIPHGDTTLDVGDSLTAFGSGTAREELAHLAEPLEEPTAEWRHPLLDTHPDREFED